MGYERVRRVTVWRDADGWRWRAQGSNWRVVATSEKAVKRKASAVAAVQKRYPDVEVVVEA